MAKNLLYKALIVAFAILVGATSAFAQKRTVRGVVSDSEGPMVGVSVVLRDPPRSAFQQHWTALLSSQCPIMMPY